MAPTFSSSLQLLLLLSLFLLAGDAASFKFSIHHRFSDSIKPILGSEGLPEKQSPGYYAAMVHRDRLLHGRRLATTTNADPPLSFVYGNETYRMDGLGFLFYANVSVGTPELIFLVALDTGSDLMWLPCECNKCPTSLHWSDGEEYKLNHYSPNASTTSSNVPCTNTLCEFGNQCTSNKNTCPYKTHSKLLPNTSSAGYLVRDIMHFSTDDSQLKPVNANITLGCGKVQTGIFSNAAAPNGLIGLGMGKISIPSMLASQGLTPNSFSMCFGYDFGRIDFGDIGPSGQRETPFNPMSSSYNVTFIQIIVAVKPSNVEFNAVFDSGFAFTYLTDPIYSLITEKMDAMMKLDRFIFDSDYPFEYCYTLPLGTIFLQPTLNFTMKGGYNYGIITAFVAIPTDDADGYAVCLAIVKTNYTNVIGHYFMAGHRIVFNREKMVMGWKEVVDCNDNGPNSPSRSPPTDDSPPSGEPAPSPSTPRRSNSRQPLVGNGTGDATRLNSLSSLVVSILAFGCCLTWSFFMC